MLRCFSCVQLSATPWTLCNPMELTRLLCPWDSPGKNTGVGCHFLLQQIFPIQRSNLHLLHWKTDSLPLSHQDLQILLIVIIIFLRYELGTHMHRNPPSTVLSRYKIFRPHLAKFYKMKKEKTKVKMKKNQINNPGLFPFC